MHFCRCSLFLQPLVLHENVVLCVKKQKMPEIFRRFLAGPIISVGLISQNVLRSHLDNYMMEIHGRPPSGETAPRPATSGERLPKSALASALVTERKDWYSVTNI